MPFHPGPVHEVKANLFRVLGHPARVRILELLREGERSVGTLQTELELDSGGTSQHLAALRRIGLVASRRDGNSV
jgi:ArsR family transcriptional regulator